MNSKPLGHLFIYFFTLKMQYFQKIDFFLVHLSKNSFLIIKFLKFASNNFPFCIDTEIVKLYCRFI